VTEAEALADDMSHQEETVAPHQDVVVTNTLAGVSDVMSLVVVNIIIEEGTAAVHLIARTAVPGETVENRMVSTPTTTDDEVLVARVEGRVVVMRKI